MGGASPGEGRLLVVNADDFGATAGVSRGILEAHRRGIVSSTTAMVNLAPRSDLEAEALGLPGLGVGLHLNLTWGRPVSPSDLVPSLVDGEGRIHDAGGRGVEQAGTRLGEQQVHVADFAGGHAPGADLLAGFGQRDGAGEQLGHAVGREGCHRTDAPSSWGDAAAPGW